jgi:hypothetical protein
VPYTLAHAAAVVPLWRRAPASFSLSALVVGSFSPDLLYFGTPDRASSTFAHTPLGLITVALPLGLALLFLFHHVLKRPAVLLLPPSHRRLVAPLLAPSADVGPARLATLVDSVLVGAVTHVLWDTFTHDRLAAGPLAPLRVPLLHLGGEPVSIARALQHASTLVGLGLLVRWYRAWLARQRAGVDALPPLEPAPSDRLRLPFLALSCVAAPALGALWVVWERPLPYLVVLWAIGTTAAVLVLLFLWSGLVWVARRASAGSEAGRVAAPTPDADGLAGAAPGPGRGASPHGAE